MRELLEECLKQLNSLDVHNDLTKCIESELAKPNEPLGYMSDTMHSILINGGHWDFISISKQKLSPFDCPVYTHPPAQQKPLTVDEIKALWEASLLNTNSFTLKFARAIEHAHGIGGEL